MSPDTPPNLMPDRARWGHLDLLNVVGRGSYGTVYRAWDTRLERLVALKLFHGVSDPDVVMQEGRMLARVRHEHVVTVYGADMIDGVAGLWMELVHGDTLEQLVKAARPAERDRSRRARRRRGRGARRGARRRIAALRHQGPERRAGNRRPRRADGSRRGPRRAGGTRFRSADRRGGHAALHGARAVPARCDVDADRATSTASACCSITWCLASFPVDGKSLGELKRAQLDNRVTPLDQVRMGLPAAFLDIVARTTARDPAQRPATAADVQSALSAIAAPIATSLKSRSIGWWAAVAAVVGLLALVARAPALHTGRPPAACKSDRSRCCRSRT